MPSWENPSGMLAGGGGATVSMGRYAETPLSFVVYDFGFNLGHSTTPVTSIDRIEVLINRRRSPAPQTGNARDHIVTHVLAVTTDVTGSSGQCSVNKGQNDLSDVWPTAANDQSFNFTTAQWGFTSLQYTDIESPNFGVLFACENWDSQRLTATANSIRVIVTYTGGSGSPQTKSARAYAGNY